MATYYEMYHEKLKKIADIYHSIALLQWDKETYMPSKGAAFRSQQVATLSALAQNEFTDPKFGRLLNRFKKMTILSDFQKRNVNITIKDYQKATKLTEKFVKRKSLAISAAYHAWIEARTKNDYTIYEPSLQALIDIVREEVSIIGYEKHPYDACLDKYEPGMTVAQLDPFFADVEKNLKPLIEQISTAKKINNKFLFKKYNKASQWEFGLEVLENMGYDFDAGRQDISTHPFTISFSPQDVRVTTRINNKDLRSMTWSCIHEGGHALYEQGLPTDQYGLPTGSAISLGIHESQSRLWENNIGRSKEYWTYFFPILKERFPKQLKKVKLEDFYKAINTIKPNLIRTEADELHYHMHVLIRYEMEKDILENKLEASDLKNVWNEKYQKYLGIQAKDDLNGILQDIHWSQGSFGYFPTYSLGSFYAAQFYAAANKDIKKLKKKLRKGDSKDLLKWLRKNIHKLGRSLEAEELCEKVTGEKLNTQHFVEYAKSKYGEVYGLKE